MAIPNKKPGTVLATKSMVPSIVYIVLSVL